MQAVSVGQTVQFIPRGAALSLERGEQRRGNDRGRNTVLVARDGGIRAETDRFFIAEGQLRSAGDPLKARERRVMFEAVGMRNAGQQTLGDDRVCERPLQASRRQEFS